MSTDETNIYRSDSDVGPSKRRRHDNPNDKYKKGRDQIAELQDKLPKANTQIELLRHELRNKDNALSTVIKNAHPQPLRQPAEVLATGDFRPVLRATN